MPPVGHFGQLFCTRHTLLTPMKLLGTVGTYLRYIEAQKEISKKLSLCSYRQFIRFLEFFELDEL